MHGAAGGRRQQLPRMGGGGTAMTGERDQAVGVVGLGFVGLPLAMACADAGYRVRGVDVDENRVAAIQAGRSGLNEVDDEELAERIGDALTV